MPGLIFTHGCTTAIPGRDPITCQATWKEHAWQLVPFEAAWGFNGHFRKGCRASSIFIIFTQIGHREFRGNNLNSQLHGALEITVRCRPKSLCAPTHSADVLHQTLTSLEVLVLYKDHRRQPPHLGPVRFCFCLLPCFHFLEVFLTENSNARVTPSFLTCSCVNPSDRPNGTC